MTTRSQLCKSLNNFVGSKRDVNPYADFSYWPRLNGGLWTIVWMSNVADLFRPTACIRYLAALSSPHTLSSPQNIIKIKIKAFSLSVRYPPNRTYIIIEILRLTLSSGFRIVCKLHNVFFFLNTFILWRL
jgi:hypothetical protein